MTIEKHLTPAAVTFTGRLPASERGLHLAWTNSGFSFRFRGTSAAIICGDKPGCNETVYVSLEVDDLPRRRLPITADRCILSTGELRDCEHTVRLTRLTEPLDYSLLCVLDVSLTARQGEPVLLSPPAPFKRRMLFIGDSITCGYGVLSTAPDSGYNTAEQDSMRTYAALTARHFQADAHYICISGRGIIDNVDHYPAPLIPQFFPFEENGSSRLYDFAAWQPEVVVVNAGTNDVCAGVDSKQFTEGVTAFLHRLRDAFPQAKLLWTYGMMCSVMHEALEQAVAAFNAEDSGAVYLPMKSVWEDVSEQGAAQHPNLRAHYRYAGVLIDAVAEQTGWER